MLFRSLTEDGVSIDDVSLPILEAYRIQARAGIHLTANDPELALIRNDTIADYIVSVQEAVNSARARMEEDGTYSKPDSALSTPGTVNGTPVVKPAHVGKTGADTLSMAFKGR